MQCCFCKFQIFDISLHSADSELYIIMAGTIYLPSKSNVQDKIRILQLWQFENSKKNHDLHELFPIEQSTKINTHN